MRPATRIDYHGPKGSRPRPTMHLPPHGPHLPGSIEQAWLELNAAIRDLGWALRDELEPAYRWIQRRLGGRG